jgi:hypothetical protein
MLNFLLLYRIDETDRHGGKMLILAILMMCIALSFASPVQP